VPGQPASNFIGDTASFILHTHHAVMDLARDYLA